ncbi:hypothetical protein [Burkholderia ubonensis]|uniref:hypothetical protein n=1 Tax=Burkholderia ubonensis TaxID=101571 RepID=UPI0012BAB5F4|nr:hypothetical protein [Burkholderia ubonensis]
MSGSQKERSEPQTGQVSTFPSWEGQAAATMCRGQASAMRPPCIRVEPSAEGSIHEHTGLHDGRLRDSGLRPGHPEARETLQDVCPIRRRQLRRAARVREFSCRRHDCSAKGYAPTSCNNSRFQLHNSLIENQNYNKLFVEFSKYENLPHKMKLSIRSVLVTWTRHPVFNSLYCFKK